MWRASPLACQSSGLLHERQAAERRDAVVHALPVQRLMHVTVRGEQRAGEGAVFNLGFLEAQHVGRMIDQKPLDDRQARTHRIDVPRGNGQLGHRDQIRHR